METDRLSLLPNSILTHILSLLPIQTAAKTSVLSHQWRNLWTQHTHLTFNFNQYSLGTQTLNNFFSTINYIVSQLTSAKIHSFSLAFPYSNSDVDDQHWYYPSLVSLLSAIRSLQIDQIQVTAEGPLAYTMFGPFTPLPTTLFRCQSIVELSLNGKFKFKGEFDGIRLPNLKKLLLRFNRFDSNWLGKLFKCCLQLEDLTLCSDTIEGEDCFDLSALKLKKLYIKIWNWDRLTQREIIISGCKLEVFAFYAPSLNLVNFVEYSGQLAILELGLVSSLDMTIGKLAEVAHMISSVHTLCLNNIALQAFNDTISNVGRVLILENVSKLTFMLDDLLGCCWNEVLLFLRYTPNLEAFHVDVDRSMSRLEKRIEWVVPDYEPPCGLTCTKKIVMTGFGEDDDAVKFMDYIVGNARALELIRISAWLQAYSEESCLWKEYQLCETLFLLERSSLACEIEFRGPFLSASSKGFKNGVLLSQLIRLGNPVRR